MKGAQYAMLMFTLVVVLARVSPADESPIWWMVAGAWFMGMVISLVKEIIEYGEKKQK